jgi:hypothetical protein
MVKTIVFIALGLIVLAVVFVLLLALRQPDSFRIQRSTVIGAPAERIYPLIADMRRMNSWNPFAKKDPQIQITYRGPASGPGAAYDFSGNKEVGKGCIEVTEAVAPTRVAMRLDVTEPMEGHHAILFSLAPDGGGTRVTWAMEGASPFLGKVMGVVFNMDKMVGGAFDAGLADLKAQAEKPV